jgi:hypothetical protein
MSGVLSTLRSQVQDRLQADDYFEDIPILTEERGDVEAEISNALGTLTEQGGKLGICVVILTARAEIKDSIPGPYLGNIGLTIHVEESVLINKGASGTQKPCSDVAERVAARLHRWTPDTASRPILATGGGIQVVAPAIGDMAYAVTLSTAAGISVAIATCATPAASPSSGAHPQTVTLSCATPGAAIFYTLDGKFPSPTGGTLYLTPVTVSSACTLKAAAWLAGLLTSDVLSVSYT